MLEELRKTIPSHVALVAVSKGQPIEKIRAALQAGQTIFGENYVQELIEKATALSAHNIEWHFLGHLQRNKIGKVLPHISFLHSLDSVALAAQLEARLQKPLPCCLEINIGQEPSKSGILPGDAMEIAQQLSPFTKIKLVGLMAIPPSGKNAEASRPYFQALRELRDQINAKKILSEPMRELSMGMSEDYQVAIQEGATIVRIGTAIFGERT